MGEELAAAGLDKCQPKATEIEQATQSSSIISSSLSQVIDIWLFCLMRVDGERVISPCTGPASRAALNCCSRNKRTDRAGSLGNLSPDQPTWGNGDRVSHLLEFKAEITPSHLSPFTKPLWLSKTFPFWIENLLKQLTAWQEETRWWCFPLLLAEVVMIMTMNVA